MNTTTTTIPHLDEADIIGLLNTLTDLQDQRQVLDIDYQTKRDEIMRPVAQQIADLEAELEPQADALNARIAALQAQIESAVLCHGTTVKAARIQAVFMRPRVRWDTLRLIKYANTHPEILDFQKLGEPSVTIRVIGGK